MQEDNNWYWKKQSLQQNIIVPILTIINPCLDVFKITDVQYTPKTVCNRINEIIQRHPIYLTDADYDYVLDDI